jgi:stage II sporulation protein D
VIEYRAVIHPLSILICVGLFAAVPSVAAPTLEQLAAAAGQQRPIMRIGLDAEAELELSARKPYRLIDPDSGTEVWKPRFEGALQVVAEGGPRGELRSIYRVQVGAFGNRQFAEQRLEELTKELGTEGVIVHDPDRGNWRVRLGRAEERLALNPIVERLRRIGLENFWIAEEPSEELSGVTMRLVDEAYDSLPTGLRRIVVLPGRGDHIRVNGKPYRGIFELRVNDFGLVRPINWVGLEKYLLGVVPAELGPEVWPELQALKAQAVAARTYAWRNRGQFEEEGFDLCGTPRCQVYKGTEAEHPLSDRAIAATRGEILTWQGKPIDALYTATCGGHTEDGREIFAEQSEPYLKGVPCRAENEALASLRATVTGLKITPLPDETGEDVTRDWALLRAAGVIEDWPLESAGPLQPSQLRSWTSRLARIAGLPAPEGTPARIATMGQAAAAMLADLGWWERAEVLLSENDIDALLRDEALAALPVEQRRALAYLAWEEALRPFPDGAFHAEKSPSLTRLMPALARIGQTYGAFGLSNGVVSGVGQRNIRLVRGKGEVRLPLAESPYLFGLSGGKAVPAEKLEIWPGDRIRYRTALSGKIDFLELRPPVKGVSDDRSAAVYSWEARKSRHELERLINRRLSLGELRDLQVVRRGVSGRIVELRVVGSRGSTIVRGFDVRRLLDLRESLMVIDLQRDERGRIEAAVFTGKGWGHGVGMCQVGAYGMALRGASYQEILGHYYTGTAVTKLSGRGR